ncbi:hypothetical protein HPB47_021652 [Ixodes persulcatus]|uniref:Uncharacterized protein n=1 Tax=Ixodes persulcatus TaxID=34615 RepID=A0AC60QEJ7_IXOPE|nr:hypothetical protein HPB47_021652 [Ixodes persulcatus]
MPDIMDVPTAPPAALKPKDTAPQAVAAVGGVGGANTQWPVAAPTTVALAQLQQQVQEIQEQIRQSEQNLAAQHQVLLQQQQVQLDEAIRKAQDDKLTAQAKSCDLEIAELDKVLQPIIESCTKDAISAGKGWIFSHSTTPQRNDLICQYLLKKVTVPGAPFDMKLHIVYLINDVLHHCVRKNADGLKQALEQFVVPIFCTTSIGVDEEKGQKLAKASLITEHAAVITSVTAAVQVKYTQLQKQHQDFVAHLTSRLQTIQFGLLQQTMTPGTGIVPGLPPPQLVVPQGPLGSVVPQSLPTSTLAPPVGAMSGPQGSPAVTQPLASSGHAATDAPGPAAPTTSQAPETPQGDSEPQAEAPRDNDNNQEPQETAKAAESAEAAPDGMNQAGGGYGPMPGPPHYGPGGPLGPGGHHGGGGGGYMGNGPHMSPFGPQPPPHYGMPPAGYNHPPPNFMHHGGPQMPGGYGGGMPPRPMHGYDPMGDEGQYYDDYDMDAAEDGGRNFAECALHGRRRESGEWKVGASRVLLLPSSGAGVVVVARALSCLGAGPGLPDVSQPPPGFVPLDSQGFPPPDLPEAMECLVPTMPYFELPAGLIVPLVKLEDSEYKALDPKALRLPPPAPPSDALMQAVEMFYSPPSHERPRNSQDSDDGGEEEDRKGDKGPKDEDRPLREDPNRRRYRESKSPPHTKQEEEAHRRKKKRSRSRSESTSPQRRHRPSRSRSRSRSPSRSRSRSGSPSKKRSPDRSPTPPSFFGSSYGGDPRDSKLDESNKGHQLLRKMGWGGAGLGAAEQGIQDPIHPGDVRDRSDLYKGVGISLHDPYENFRKSKGQAFINRMKARSDDIVGK